MEAIYFDDLEPIDFLQNADNVYRTQEYIVKQKLSLSRDKNMEAYTISTDTYFARTRFRDRLFDESFSNRVNVDGKRVKASAYIRSYID